MPHGASCQGGRVEVSGRGAWCGRDNSCVTSKMRNDQSECLAGKTAHAAAADAAAAHARHAPAHTHTLRAYANWDIISCDLQYSAEPAEQMCNALSGLKLQQQQQRKEKELSCCSKVISKVSEAARV